MAVAGAVSHDGGESRKSKVEATRGRGEMGKEKQSRGGEERRGGREGEVKECGRGQPGLTI